MNTKSSHNTIRVSESDGYIIFTILDSTNKVSVASYDISNLNVPNLFTGMPKFDIITVYFIYTMILIFIVIQTNQYCWLKECNVFIGPTHSNYVYLTGRINGKFAVSRLNRSTKQLYHVEGQSLTMSWTSILYNTSTICKF